MLLFTQLNSEKNKIASSSIKLQKNKNGKRTVLTSIFITYIPNTNTLTNVVRKPYYTQNIPQIF